MVKGKVYIGTSGWSYGNWRGYLYTDKAKSTGFLAQYAERFHACEINNSFYRLPKIETVEKWVEQVPAKFRFCPKMSRFLTHMKRLHEPDEPLARFFETFKPLRAKLGPVLIQLPPSLKFDADLAEGLYKRLRKDYAANKFAMEVRHNSWLTNESVDILVKYNIAFVIAQSNNLFPYAELVTAKHIYVRFHGPGKLFDSSYSASSLNYYAEKFVSWIKGGHEIWCFFNNTANIHALNNAFKLKELLAPYTGKIR